MGRRIGAIIDPPKMPFSSNTTEVKIKVSGSLYDGTVEHHHHQNLYLQQGHCKHHRYHQHFAIVFQFPLFTCIPYIFVIIKIVTIIKVNLDLPQREFNAAN